MVDWREAAGAARSGIGAAAHRAVSFSRAAGRRLGRGARAARERHLAPRLASAFGLVLVALVGISIGLLLGGRIHQDVGPFTVPFVMRPSLSGGTAGQN